MGRDPALASGGEGAEEGDRTAVETGREDGAASHQPVDAAAAGVAATARDPGPWRERITQWLREEPRLTAKRIPRLLLPMAGPLPARTVRRYVAGLRTATTRQEAFRAPQRAARHDDGGRLRRVVGRHRRRAVQGGVSGGDAAVLQRVLRQGVPDRAARVVARRHRVGVPVLREHRGSRRPR